MIKYIFNLKEKSDLKLYYILLLSFYFFSLLLYIYLYKSNLLVKKNYIKSKKKINK